MQKESAWLQIWVRPKATIQKVIEKTSKKSFFILMFFLGFSSFMNLSQNFLVGYKLNVLLIFLFGLIMAFPLGLFLACISSFFVNWFGRWFGGNGNFHRILRLTAWSSVPLGVNSVIWIILLVIFGSNLFKDFPANSIQTTFEMGFVVTLLTMKLIMSIWAFIIYLNGLCVAHEFRLLFSLITIVFMSLFSLLIFVVLWMVFFNIFSYFLEIPKAS